MKNKLLILAFLVSSSFILTGCAMFTGEPSGSASYDGNKGIGDEGYFVRGADGQMVSAPAEAPAASRVYKTGYSKTSIAYPTGRKDNSVLWIEKSYPNTVRIGKPYTYTIDVTNLTALSVSNVVLTEQLPSGFKLISSNPVANTVDGKMQWVLGNFHPRETKSISITGMTDAKAELPCCTAATYDPPSLCVSTSVVQPDLKLEMKAADRVTACQSIPLDFVVTNPGDAHITDVKITSQLPQGVTVNGRNEVVINVGDLGPGASKNYSETAQAQTTGSYNFAANVVASDDLSATAQASTVVVKPALAITTAVDASQQYVGRSVNYSVTVSNTGNAVAESTSVNASLEGARGESASDDGSVRGGGAKWNIGSLEPGASKTLSLKGIATDAGVAKIDATAMAECSDDVSAAATTNVVGVPAILLEVIDVADPIEIGNEETYIIKVTNQGSAPDSNIKIEAVLDENEDYVSSSGPTEATVSGKTVTFAPLSKIDAKDAVSWKVVIKGTKAADARFKVYLNSDQLTKPVAEDEATTIY